MISTEVHEDDVDEQGRVLVSLDISTDALWKLFHAAHALDITLNQFIERVIEEELKRGQTTSDSEPEADRGAG